MFRDRHGRVGRRFTPNLQAFRMGRGDMVETGIYVLFALFFIAVPYYRDRLGPEAHRNLIFAGVAAFVVVEGAIRLHARRAKRAKLRAWREACEGAGFVPAEDSLNPTFPDYQGTVAGREVNVAYFDDVWLYLRGTPKPDWASAPELWGVKETEQDEAEFGAAIGFERATAEELRRLANALAAQAR